MRIILSPVTPYPENANVDGRIACAKCDHSNPAGREVCEGCGSHLFVFCRECGQKNERGRSRCACGADLHRSRRRRSLKKVLRKRTKQILLSLALLLFGASVIYLVIVLMRGLTRLVFF